MIKRSLPAILASGALLLSASSVFASTLSLFPGATTVNNNTEVPITINLDANPDVIGAVYAYLSYPADKLEVNSISYDGGGFPTFREETFGNGTIKISRINETGVNGFKKVATVNFKSKSSGTANLAFIEGSAAKLLSNSNDNLNFSSSKGSTITISSTSATTATSSATASVKTTTTKKTASSTPTQLPITATASQTAVGIGIGMALVLASIIIKLRKQKELS